MNKPFSACSAGGIEEILERFELRWSSDDDYLLTMVEQNGLHSNLELVVELIRADIDRRYMAKREIDLKRYTDWFPKLKEEPRFLHPIGFEDFRSRKTRGLALEAQRWSWIPQIQSCEWYRELERRASNDAPSVWFSDSSKVGTHPTEPKVGARFGDFQLLALLGTGTFSRVFLATQQSLASRYVALKVVKRSLDEPAHLARLQHTGIVPIFSLHRIGGYSVLCMPYYGSATLADWLEEGQTSFNRNGQSLISTVKQAQTRLGSHDSVDSELSQDPTLVKEIDRIRLWNRSATQPLSRLLQLDANGCVLWLARRIASALAHAHEREVVHGDLKPANVVLRNDGEPSLIDFNLAKSIEEESSHIGGTLPYMSPEQLQTLLGRRLHLSTSSDIYSFGMMFFQIIENRLPFPAPLSVAENDIASAIRQRREGISLSSTTVSPGFKAIIRKCLEYDVERRYASGTDLLDDLEQEAGNRPLRHAKESFFRSQLPKLVRRYPRLLSVTPVLLLSCILVSITTVTGVRWRNLSREREARELLTQWQKVIGEQLPLVLSTPEGNPSDAIERIDQHFHLILGEQQDLLHPEMIHRLSQEERQTSGWEICDELLCAAGLALEHRSQLNSHALESLERWLKFCDSADRWIGSLQSIEGGIQGKWAPLDSSSIALEHGVDPIRRDQRTVDEDPSRPSLLPSEDLWKGQAEEELKSLQLSLLSVLTKRSPMLDGSRSLLKARALIQRDQSELAVATLADLAPRKPLRGIYWITVGDAERKLNHREAAHLAYSLFIHEAPHAAVGFLKRAQLSTIAGDWKQAEKDCDSLLRIHPKNASFFAERARVREQLGQVGGAISDLDRAIDLEPTNRFYFFRSKLHQKNDMQKSKEDFLHALRRTPRSVEDWISRALAQLPRYPEKALSDLKQAESIEPFRFEVLQNMAHIYSEFLHDEPAAIQALGTILEHHPENDWARVDRCVLLARTGQHQHALQEIDSIIQQGSTMAPSTHYQIACVHALLMSERPESKEAALQNLATAVINGYGRDLIATDKDLDPLRGDPRFQALAQVTQLERGNSRLK